MRREAGGAFSAGLGVLLRRAATATLPAFALTTVSLFVSPTPLSRKHSLRPGFLLGKMAPIETDAVRVYKGLVDSLLDRAVQVKPDGQIEPPLTETLVGKAIWEAPEGREQEAVQQLNQQTRLAAVEIAFREKFYRILVRRDL